MPSEPMSERLLPDLSVSVLPAARQNRLLDLVERHGQVTVAWVGTVGANHLIVANDEVAADELQRILLPQAARGVPTSILSIADAVTPAAGGHHSEQQMRLIER